MPRINTQPPFSIAQGTLIQPLTDTEGRLLWSFMLRGGLTTEEMAQIVWGKGWNWPETYIRVIHTKISLLRKKLKPLGWTISMGKQNVAKRFLEQVPQHQLSKMASGGVTRLTDQRIYARSL